MTLSEREMPVSTLLFHETLRVTEIADFGVKFEDLASGRIAIPAQGARFDIYYEGPIEGPRIKGYIDGVDYLEMRADGRCDLNIQATISADNGARIAMASSGMLRAVDPETRIARVHLDMRFSALPEEYAWLNQVHAWGTGTVNMKTGEIHVSVYDA